MRKLELKHILRRLEEYKVQLPAEERVLLKYRRIGKKAILLLREANLTVGPYVDFDRAKIPVGLKFKLQEAEKQLRIAKTNKVMVKDAIRRWKEKQKEKEEKKNEHV